METSMRQRGTHKRNWTIKFQNKRISSFHFDRISSIKLGASSIRWTAVGPHKSVGMSSTKF